MKTGQSYREVLDMIWVIALRQFRHYRLTEEIDRLKKALYTGFLSEASQKTIMEKIKEMELYLYHKSYTEDVAKKLEEIKKKQADIAADSIVDFMISRGAQVS